jgi:hypothetical protein
MPRQGVHPSGYQDIGPIRQTAAKVFLALPHRRPGRRIRRGVHRMAKSKPSSYRTAESRAIQRLSASLLLVVAIVLLLSALYGSYTARRFNQRHGTTTAVVSRVEIELRPRARNHGRYGNRVVGTDRLVTLFVRFPTDRGMIHTRIELGRSGETFAEGENVPVLYDPWKPRHARLAEYERIPEAVTTTLMMAGVLLVVWRISLPDE